MGIGIQICGLNGCGKSTVGKALAKAMGFHFIDNENLYFSRTDGSAPYANPRPKEEVEKLLLDEIYEHPNFVFSAVKGDYGCDVVPLYDLVVVLEVPKEIRMQRVRDRSFRKFGSRMLPGGDVYDWEESFFQMVASRTDDYVEKWLHTVQCHIIRVDGTMPIEEIVARLTGEIEKISNA